MRITHGRQPGQPKDALWSSHTVDLDDCQGSYLEIAGVQPRLSWIDSYCHWQQVPLNWHPINPALVGRE